MKEAILKLKNEVKRFTAEGRALGGKIRQSKGLDRYHLWNEKRSLGVDARCTLLAYACLRGRLYTQIEAKNHEGNEPSATYVHDILSQVLDDTRKAEWTPERVRAWLKREMPPAVQETASEVAA